MPTSICIVYHSSSGHTEVIARSIADGANAIDDVTARLVSVDEIAADQSIMDTLDAADGLIFGSPTFMGAVSAAFKQFCDDTGLRWFERRWKDKFAGGFTNSGSYCGDKFGTLSFLSVFAAQHGMIWVGQAENPPPARSGHGAPPEAINRLGSSLGVMTQADSVDASISPPEGDRRTAELYGRRFAELTSRWIRGHN